MVTGINQNDPNDFPRLLTKKQAAQLLQVCCRTLERWFNQRYITKVQIGGRVYVPYSEIIRIVNQSVFERVYNDPLTEAIMRTAIDPTDFGSQK